MRIFAANCGLIFKLVKQKKAALNAGKHMAKMEKQRYEGQERKQYVHREPRPLPRTLVAATSIIVILIVLVSFNQPLIFAKFGIEEAILNLASYGLIAIFAMVWLLWIIFFSRRSFFISKFIPIAILIGIVGFLSVYQIRFSGSMRMIGLENRFKPLSYMSLDGTVGKANVAEIEGSIGFNQFLGPNRTGYLTEPLIDPDWETHRPKLKWKTEIGQGWSGFVAVGDSAFTIEQRNEMEVVSCRSISNDGNIVWAKEFERRHENAMGGVGPRSTPTISGDKLLAVGGTGMLYCLDINDGELIWSQNVPELVGIDLTESKDIRGNTITTENSSLLWGRSSSPLVHNGVVIVPGGGPVGGEQTTFLGFDLETGDVKWQNGELAVAYGSPIIMTLDGTEQIVMVCEDAATGNDIATGETLWTYSRKGNSSQDANSSQPVLAGPDTVLFTKGYGLGGELVRVFKNNDGDWETEQIWQNQRVMQTKFSSAVIVDDHAYAISEQVLECVSVADGKRVWREGRVGFGQMLVVGDFIVAVTERRGEILLYRAAPSPEEIARVKTDLEGTFWNNLCIYDNYLLIRSDKECACYELTTMFNRPKPENDGDTKEQVNDAPK